MKKLVHFIFFITCFYSIKAQTDWVATNSRDTFTNAALFSKGDSLFAAIAGTGIYVTTDNGVTWFRKNRGLTNTFVNTLAANQQYIFAGTLLGSNSGVFCSNDNGENWERVINGLNSLSINVLKNKGDTLFAGTGTGFYYTIDNGNNWVKPTAPVGDDIQALYIKDSIIICFNQQRFFRSANNGISWQLVAPFNVSIPIDIVETRNGLVLATSASGLYRSTDTGKTWTPIPATNIGNIASFIAYDTVLFVGENYKGVFKSVDAGQTWTQFGQGLPSVFYRSLAVHKNMLYVGTDGKKIWRRPLEETSSIQRVQPAIFQMIIFPNPAVQTATLHYELKEKTTVEITLLDVNGRVIKRVFTGTQNAGKQEINLLIQDLLAGTYTCNLQTAKQITAVPLQIVK